MDNLPNNPSAGNNNPASPASPNRDEPDGSQGGPPPFGPSFNPHTNPPDPNPDLIGANNPYQTPPQPTPIPPLPQTPPPNIPNPPNYPNPPLSSEVSAQEGHSSIHEEVAQHRPRDAQGHFLPYEHPGAPSPNPNQTDPPILVEPSGPKPNTFSEKIKSIWHFFSKNYKKIGTIIAFIYLVAMNSSFQSFVAQYFPNSSPILSRAVSMQGLLKTSQTGIYTLVLPDQSSYILHFKPTAALTNLKKLNEVVVKGNLTWTPYTIENAEIYPLNISLPEESPPPDSSATPYRNEVTGTGADFPKFYSDIKWETDQKKLLLFTSGKRRIEQEGVYLESVQMTEIPQAFLDYYTNQLTNLGFKQTLNSSQPIGTTITFAKDDLFLTFGVKNVYSGSGDNRKIVGYRAFIEHN